MLNENLEFATAPQDVKDAFIGKVDKLPMNAGTKFFKRTGFPLVGPKGITAWWSFVETTKLPSGIVADGLRQSEELAHRVGASHRDYQRVRAAVSERFGNSMRHLLIAELSVGVWGFAGKASGQKEFNDPELRNVYLIGGAVQVWIPNLTISHIHEIPRAI